MKESRLWNRARARGPDDASESCSVEGCAARPTFVMAADGSGTTRMCLRHAKAWSDSSLCKDLAQHNSGATHLALSTWLDLARAGGLAANLA